jgi:hypothetical protein
MDRMGLHALSKAATDTALLLKKRSRRYRSICNNMPPRPLSLINEQMTVDSLGTGDAKEVFTNFFRKNWRNNDESRSGRGAELKRTESVRVNLADFARRRALGSLVDAPCDDCNWTQHVGYRRISDRSARTSSTTSSREPR